MHQTAGNILCTLKLTHLPQTLQEAQMLVDSALATTMNDACWMAIHTTLKTSPGAFVFQQDKFLDIPIIANLQTIQEQ
jgi:hypothetical protein